MCSGPAPRSTSRRCRRSPLFLIDDATLIALHDAVGNNWLRALHDPPAGLSTELRARCMRAAHVLDALRVLAATAPVDAVLERALAETGYEAAWAPLQG